MSGEPDTSLVELEAVAVELSRRGDAALAQVLRGAASRAGATVRGLREGLRQFDARLDDILQVVTYMTAMDFGHKVEVLDEDDWLVKALAIGLNMMGDEFRRTTEELTEARDRALAASRAKSVFLANMSHELRTPLNAIIGYSEMLREECQDQLDTTQLRDIERVVFAARHLLSVIKDTLDLSKIEAGRMEVSLESFAVAELLHEVLATLTPIVHERGNRLDADFPPDLGVMRSDRTKLAQSLYNLLGNANKFTTLGTIRFAARVVSDGPERSFEFIVEDTGIGIPRDKLNSVFSAFNQADDSIARRFGGTGLGLTITRHFCEMLGGEISVCSEVGQGSTFTLRLPAEAPVAARVAARRSQHAAANRGNTLLVVSPDPILVELVRLHLDGVTVVMIPSGGDAARVALALRPAAVLLDDHAESEAWSTLIALKADPELPTLPIFIAAHADVRAKAISLGAADVIRKPLRRESLQPLLSRLSPSLKLGHVLVVGDEAARRSVPQRLLAAHGWQISEAPDLASARAALASTHVDALIHGLDASEHLVLVEAARGAPVFNLTADSVSLSHPGRLLKALAQQVHIARSAGR